MIEPEEFFISVKSNGLSPLSFSAKLPRSVNLYSAWKVGIAHITTTLKIAGVEIPTFGLMLNILEESSFNTECVKMLRILSLNSEWGKSGIFSKDYSFIHYLPIKIKTFSELEIDLINLNQSDLNAISGTTFVTLHFVRG